jgi:hypothetical protein
MSAGRNNVTPAMMAVICPRAAACTDADQLAFSGFVLEPLVGGNIADIEERVYHHQQTKSSWSVLAFVLFTALAVWTGGAILAGSASWGVVNGAVVALGTSGAAAAPFIAGTTVAAAAGLGYASLNAMLNSGSLTSPQKHWLGEMGMSAETVSHGEMGSSACNNQHCRGLNAAASDRHVKSGSPGTASSGNNLQATRLVVAGIAPTVASHPNHAYNSEVYERKRGACIDAGHGSSQQTLYRCMAASLVVDGSSGEQ